MYGRLTVGLWPLVRPYAHKLPMYSPSQVSEMLDIPGSSLRRLASQFSDKLSESANKRRRQYTDEDILVLKRVRELTGQGMSIEEIQNVIDVVPQETAPPDSALALLPTILQEFESLRSEISDLRSEVNDLKEWKSERESKTAEYKKIPRWRRVFTDPPD